MRVAALPRKYVGEVSCADNGVSHLCGDTADARGRTSAGTGISLALGSPSAALGSRLTLARFVFLLLDEFSLVSLSAALKVANVANRTAGWNCFDCLLTSETGQSVRSSSGLNLEVGSALEDLRRGDIIVVCGGENIEHLTSHRVLSWLRREARKGVKIGGLCTGGFALAKAGLLNNRRATIHWEKRESFSEAFPDVELSDEFFVIDRDRFTTAGGTAAVDLILELVDRVSGMPLSSKVAIQLNYFSIRDLVATLKISVAERTELRHPRLLKAVEIMQNNLEDPKSPEVVAKETGVSVRQLERLFKRYLKTSPLKFYRSLRMQRARQLLLQTRLPIIEIAFACGYQNIYSFTKSFRQIYGTSPLSVRQRVGVPPWGPSQ